MRQVVLDTETTGLSAQHGHRITDVACVEVINRKITGRVFQSHINPERELDERAMQITGLSWQMLKDKPKFVEIVDALVAFIDGAELIIHNAPFDLSFLEHEVNLIKHPWAKILQKIAVIDTLSLARAMHPGQKNSLDALCKRYFVNNSHRNYHGALLDAEILARVYLAMTAGQTSLDLLTNAATSAVIDQIALIQAKQEVVGKNNLKIIYPTEEELTEHAAMLALINKQHK